MARLYPRVERFSSPTRLAAVLATLVMAGCGAGPSGASATQPVTADCPTHAWTPAHRYADDVTTVEPMLAQRVIVCRYASGAQPPGLHGDRVITDPAVVNSLRTALNALPRDGASPPAGTVAVTRSPQVPTPSNTRRSGTCGADLGVRILAEFIDSTGRQVDIRLDVAGCAFVSNGSPTLYRGYGLTDATTPYMMLSRLLPAGPPQITGFHP